VIKPENGIHLV